MHSYHKLLLLLLLRIGGQSAHGAKIINGGKVPDNTMLHMASLWNKGEHICGGFLVNDEYVLTAAHCEKASSVILGTHHLSSATNDMKYDVAKMCKHESYVEPQKGNDIMLLKLSRKAQGSKVKVIDLPKSPVQPKADDMCVVAGWGYLHTGGKPVNDLMRVNVNIISREECKRLWGPLLPQSTICAGGYNTIKGFCQCDSGGPLLCGNVPAGIVSFNRNGDCKYPNKAPNVYTDISAFLPWIDNILKNGC